MLTLILSESAHMGNLQLRRDREARWGYMQDQLSLQAAGCALKDKAISILLAQCVHLWRQLANK